MIEFIKKRRLWYLIYNCYCYGFIRMVQNYRSFNHIFNLGIDFTGGSTMTLRFEQNQNYESSLRRLFESIKQKKLSIQTLVLEMFYLKLNKWM